MTEGFPTRGERRLDAPDATDAEDAASEVQEGPANAVSEEDAFDVGEEAAELAEQAAELAEQARELADHVGEHEDEDEEGFPTERES